MSTNNESSKDSVPIDKNLVLFEVIKRYDAYIISTNAKSSLLIAFNSLLLGTILLKFGDIVSFFNAENVKTFVGFVIFIISISSIISLFYILQVIYPFFGNNDNENNIINSLIYFGSVSDLTADNYFVKIDIATTKDLTKDLAYQAIILAKGLKEKMTKMRTSIGWLMFSLFSILLLVFMRAFQVGI